MNHALALKSDGSVWAWGDNSSGQLGSGASEGQMPSPQQVRYASGETLTGFVKVAAGGNHSMGLRSDGTLWEWGGWITANNNAVNIVTPRQVTLPKPVKDMVTGGYFCLALLEDGTVWGWGKNDWGQMATGIGGLLTSFYEEPVQVVGPLGVGHLTDVVKLVASDSYAAALTSDGKLYGWGNNSSNPLAILDFLEINWKLSVPTLITAFPEPVVDLDAGAYGLGAVLESGKVWATADPWAHNGQVFTGDGDDTSTPMVTDAKQVAMGANSAAALTTSGKVWTRGVNGTDDNPSSSFILGNPTVYYQSLQAQVMGPNGEGYLTDAIYLAEGNNTAYVIREDGTLWSWGSNQYGQLGIGVAGDGVKANASKVPAAVSVDGAQFRLSPSAVASLKAISLNGAAISGFSPDVKQYALGIDSGTASVRIVAEPSDSDSTVRINHSPVGNEGYAEVALQTGTNVIGIEVTASDGFSKEAYNVKLYVGPGSEIPDNDWQIRVDEDNSAMTQSINLPDGGSILIQSLPTADSQIIRSKHNGEMRKVLMFSNHKTVSVLPMADSGDNFALVSNVSSGIELVQMDQDLNLQTPSTVMVGNDSTWTGKTALKAKSTSDGGIVIIGKATQSSGWTMPYFVKLDATWKVVMETGFVVSEDLPDVIYDVVEDGAGGYVVTGTLSVGGDSPSLWVAHLANDGEMDNVKTFQRNIYQEGQSIVHTEDEGYLVAGTSASSGNMTDLSGIWLLKLDSSLNLVWDTFTESNGPVSVKSLIPLSEGGYAAAGMRDGMADLTAFSEEGYELWHHSDESGKEWLHVIRTLDGGFMTAGAAADGKALYKKWSGPNLRLSYISLDEQTVSVPATVANPQEPDKIRLEVEGSSSSVALVPYLAKSEMKLTVDGTLSGSGETIHIDLPAGTSSKTVELTVQTPNSRYARSYLVELIVIPVNKEDLHAAIVEAETFLEKAVAGTEVGQYPSEAIESLREVLEDAILVYDEAGSSQSEVDRAWSYLNEMLDSLPSQQIPYADKITLASTLQQASQLMKQTVKGSVPGATPPSAFDMLQAAYVAAKAVMLNFNAGQEQVDSASESLIESIVSFQNAVILPSPAYFEDFEGGDGGYRTEGENSTWAYGTPNYSSGPSSAYSGTAVWGTNLTGDYKAEERSFLLSGPIDASGSRVSKVVISAQVWEQTEKDYDYIYIDVSKDGGQTWQTVHKYTGGRDSDGGEGEGEGEVREPSSRVSTDWKKLNFDLDSSYAVPNLQMRFHLSTDGSIQAPGIYVDDVAVYVVENSLRLELLTAEQQTIANLTEGQLPGEYRYGAGSMLQSSYVQARQVDQDPNSDAAEREAQLNKLHHTLDQAAQLKVNTPLGTTVPNGSIVSYGGHKWIMLDNDSGKMVSLENTGTSAWSEDGSNAFDPEAEGTLAYKLNHSFLEAFEHQDWMQEHAWDVNGIDGRSWDGTTSVSAKVGLLSANDYLQYGSVYPGGSGMLGDLAHVWTLTPAYLANSESMSRQGLYQVVVTGDLSGASPQVEGGVKPVIYVRTDLVQAAGSGTYDAPFTLMPDTEDLQAARTASLLTDWFQSINPGIDSVTNEVYAERLMLPQNDANGVVLRWDSDQSNVVDPLTGEVKKPLPGQSDAEVELTAVVSKNMSVRNVNFTLVVKANPISETEIVAADKASLTLASILGSNADANQVTTNLVLPKTGALGSTITWESDSAAITADGTVTRGSHAEGDRTVQLNATLNKGGASETVTFTLVVKANPISEAEIVTADKASLTLASILGSNADANQVTTNLVLPKTGALGSTITWESDSVAITADGTVTRGSHAEGDRTVQLHATLNKGGASETVTFTLVVKANPISEAEIVTADKASLTLASILGSNADANQVTTNLVLPKTGALGSTITWESDSAAITADGTVTRPVAATGDAIVHLTATLIKGETKQYAEFKFTVLSKEPIQYGAPYAVTANEPLIFSDGVVLDLQGLSIPAGTTVTAELVNPDVTGTTLKQAGPVIKFTFHGMDTNQLEIPVRLQFPVTPGTDLSKIGIFYLNEMNGKWEYQRTNRSSGVVTTLVSHFSTYGVFTADQVSAPIANPASGSILQAGKSVQLATATDGANIYYTLDGSDPTSESTLYDSGHMPTAMDANGLTVRAIAQKNGMLDSVVQAFAYTTSTASDNAKMRSILASTERSFSNLLVVTPDVATESSIYAATVSNDVYSVYVNALAEHLGANVSMDKDGHPVTVSDAVYLNVGVNPILISVTAENGNQRAYTLNVNRLGSHNADISDIQYGGVPLGQSGHTFTLNVDWHVTNVSLLVHLSDPNAQMSVTDVTYDMNGINITNISFDASQNLYPLVITAQDGTVKTYQLQIVRSREPSKELLDTNHDGFISIEDVTRLVFEQFDVDGNGFDANDVTYLLSQIGPLFVNKE
ncbi:immunoglobulin-like domain-containing protein [Paenibacillus sp. GCM10023248]